MISFLTSKYDSIPKPKQLHSYVSKPNKNENMPWFGLMDRALAVDWRIPGSIHMPRLQAWTPVEGMKETANQWLSLIIDVAISLSPSPFLSEINNIFKN